MRFALSLLVFTLLSAMALCQFEMMNMNKMTSRPSMALQRQDIKKELKLRKDQSSEIDKAIKELNKAMGQANPNNMASLGAPLEKIKETDEKILTVLDEPQKKRLSEVQIQM